MDRADLIITKPGGVTIAEALVKRLPILIMDAIPGQEERNARFLLEAGSAYRLPSDRGLPDVLEKILDDPKMLQDMSEAAAKLARPYACEDISRLVLDLIGRKNRIPSAGISAAKASV
jgi:processive 1,2-diacylglycerol beta-glucosyltransferase